MGAIRRHLPLLAVILGLAALMFALQLPDRAHKGANVEADAATAEQRAMRTALQRIAAQSRGGPQLPPVRSGRRASETAEDRGREAPSGPEDGPLPAPVPPAGYAFVAAPTQMRKAPLPEASRRAAALPTAAPDWLGGPDSIAALVRQAKSAGRGWSFGWLHLAGEARLQGVEAALRRLGGELLGASGSLLRARLPGDADSLAALAALPEVLGLGAQPKQRKLAALPSAAADAPAYEQTPVFITLMTDDPDGRWRRALQGLGAVVGHFHPDIRVYPANVTAAALNAVSAADFVQAVQPVGAVRAAHDLAVPAMGADALRTYGGSPGMFSGGGASVPVGVMDTGLNLNHLDIASNRASICGANLQTLEPTPLEDDADLWRDQDGHGTHVTGTLVGNGYNDPAFAGVAPSVQHIRFAKVLNSNGAGTDIGIMSGMDFLAKASGCPGGTSTEAVTPLIVNMSLSADNRLFNSRGAEERKLDSTVWTHRQLYVVVQGNADVHGFSNYGAAKNSLAVGAVRNNGALASFSSLGPTADGRLAPQVVASGVQVRSLKGDGSQDEYAILSGTSMASPAVAGVAALLMDAEPAHRLQPALVRARLMASAIKPDPWLEAPERFPANNTEGPGALQNQYGLGKASAHTSVLIRDQADGWVSGSAVSEPQAGEYAWRDIVVPDGASRLDLVLTWDEPPSEAIGDSVLNDLDLWLDRGADCGAGPCGEQSSRSRRDNVEWIFIRNPQPGTYRAKVAAHRIYGAAPRAALAWSIIRGPSTPRLQLSADSTTLSGGGPHRLKLTVSTDGYVAAGTRLVMSCRGADGATPCEQVTVSDLRAAREDGVSIGNLNAIRADGEADLQPREALVNFIDETMVQLGEIVAGESQEVEVSLSLAESDPSDAVRLYFSASAWNAAGASLSVDLLAAGASAGGAPVAPPANDGFAAAAAISGSAGSRPFDLLRSTTEPAEQLFEAASEWDAAHTLWYAWRAPAQGLYRFATQDIPPGNRVDVFRGDRLADLQLSAFGGPGATFFAEAGQSYRIRLITPPLNDAGTLRWSEGRPSNDDFGAATAISGESGASEGFNLGAGLEPGEWFGNAAATVWHHWTAPRDGLFAFHVDAPTLRTSAFVGDRVSNLRLASGFPTNYATLRAGAGRRYRIAVAAPNVKTIGQPFSLRWEPVLGDPSEGGNNDFQDATELPAESSSSWSLAIDETASLEPDEPAETGVRTKWWAWAAPTGGRFTFRLTNTQSLLFRIAAFSGAGLGSARLLAASEVPAVTPEFTFDAAQGERYRISLGFLADGVSAFELSNANVELRWAPTPANDGLATAAAIGGGSGSVSSNNQYATTERDEPSQGLGHSSLWWSFEAPAAGAYRFQTTGQEQTLTVYRRTGDGFGGLQLIERGGAELAFNAAAGARYAIRVGTNGGEGGDFTLSWQKQDSHAGGGGHLVPLFPAAAVESGRDCEALESGEMETLEGFVRIINRSARSGEVRIDAFDDAGTPGANPVTLRLEAGQRVHFNSGDLEQGATAKPLTGAIGQGEGDWRLNLESDLDIEVMAYARSKPCGFLTSLHDLAPCTGNRCQVIVFNPARNANQRSLLRLINPGAERASVTITGVDDGGLSPGAPVRLQLPAGAARTLTAMDLETGNGRGLSGALNAGRGKWELSVEADRQIHVMSLMRSPTGHLTNLSTTGRPAEP